jgi:hypothetical protein
MAQTIAIGGKAASRPKLQGATRDSTKGVNISKWSAVRILGFAHGLYRRKAAKRR